MSPQALFGRVATGLATVVVMLALALPAQARGLASDWVGAYGYEDGRDAVFFNMSVTKNGKILTGYVEETQTFGSRSPDGVLRARVVGSINGHYVTFTKTYDGSGGQNHSVTYRGTLVEDGDSGFMFGTWHLGSDVGSWFATVPTD